MNNYRETTRIIGGIPFRPLSAASLALLFMVGSPILSEGTIGHADLLVYAWIHAAPIPEIIEACKARQHQEAALAWGHTAPPVVFKTLTEQTISAAVTDMENAWTDTDSGFCPVSPLFYSAPVSKPMLKKSGRMATILRSISTSLSRMRTPSAGSATR